MGEFKSSISLLCNILNLLCKEDILKPGHFSVAKHDETNITVIAAFWNILNILSQNTNKTNIVKTVKLYFAGLNYICPEFYSLPDDMSNGSKELLLALSWLIGQENIMVSLVWNEIGKSKARQEFFLNSDNSSQNLDINPELYVIEDYKNSVLLLAGKINAHIKMASETNQKLAELIAKIHAETRKSNNISYLSTADIYHIKYPKSAEPYMNEMKHISNLLLNYNKWTSKEKYFWKWMVTVVKEPIGVHAKYVDLVNTKSFFDDLRREVKKQILVKNTTETVETEKDTLERCIYFAGTPKSTFLHKTIERLQKDENKYVGTICHRLQDIVQQKTFEGH